MVSVLVITLDRFEVSSKTISKNMEGYSLPEVELLCADNASRDDRIIEAVSKEPCLTYHRLNAANDGCAKTFNQLYLRSKADFICLMGNDIEMPKGWLEAAVIQLAKTPRAGFVGFDWGHGGVPPLSTKFGIEAHWLTPQLNRVFGTMVFPRALVGEIGFFYEGYGPYGLEDSDLSERANIAGFNSCYLKGMKSKHLVHDVGESTPYRRMKDESMAKNLAIFGERLKNFRPDNIKEPLPSPC